MDTKDLPCKIRELRAKYNLTLEQVAKEVGVGKSTVRKWETGMIENMRRDKIAKLAIALHTTPAYLMGWDEDSSLTETPSNSISLSEQEETIILAYRKADPLDQALVRRVLHIDSSGQEAAASVG